MDEYLDGGTSLQKLADKHDLPKGTIAKWMKGRKPLRRCRACKRSSVEFSQESHVGHICRPCHQKQHRERRRKSSWRKRMWIAKYAASLGCHECGMNNPVVLDWHHIDAETKKFGISDMVNDNRSWLSLFTELAKCIPLCSNCHRIKHAEEDNWYAQPE